MSTAVHLLIKEPKSLIAYSNVDGNFPLDEAVITGMLPSE